MRNGKKRDFENVSPQGMVFAVTGLNREERIAQEKSSVVIGTYTCS